MTSGRDPVGAGTTDLPEPFPHFPIEPGPHRMAMGLRSLKPDDWIEIDAGYRRDMASRRLLLSELHDAVFRALPQAREAGREVLDLLADHLPRRFPHWFARSGDRLSNRLTGEDWDLAAGSPHPLEIAGRLVQEDLCVLQPDAGGHVLTAAVLCFPSRWRLSDKIGRPLAVIHEPVARYDTHLERPVDRFMAILKPDRPVWRLNWALSDDPALFLPDPADGPSPVVTADDAGGGVFLRVERQTLRRLPRTGAVLFTIRTHLRPVAAVAGQGHAARLADAVRGLPPDVARYKGIDRFAGPLLAYLDRFIDPGASSSA